MSLRDEVEASIALAQNVQSCEQKLALRDQRIREMEAMLQKIVMEMKLSAFGSIRETTKREAEALLANSDK